MVWRLKTIRSLSSNSWRDRRIERGRIIWKLEWAGSIFPGVMASSTSIDLRVSKKESAIQELSLLGGPLQWLGCRLGLVRDGSNTIRLGVALGLFCWVVLLALAFLEGFGRRIFSLPAIGSHVRLLVAIPLMFLGETCVAPQMAEFARYVVRSGLVPAAALTALASNIRRTCQLKDSRLAEGLLFLVAFALPLVGPVDALAGKTSSWAVVLQSTGGKFPWTTGWYLGFCLPFFRFLLFRWLWRLGLWWWFLWRLHKLELRLVPTHSDSTAGLGFLEVVHENFAAVILAISAVCSAQFAEDISSGTMVFDALYGWVPIVLLLTTVLFMAPLCMFSQKLWKARNSGMSEYMAMADRYVKAFDHKWIRGEEASGESQLGTADLQSLADLTNSLNVVRGMRWIPVGQRQMTILFASTIAPLLPLLLLKYPIDQVTAKVFQMLTGM